MSSSSAENMAEVSFDGVRVALVGKLAGMTKREALQLLRSRGAVVADSAAAADLVVVGEDALPLVELGTLLDEQGRQAVENGTTRLMTETQLWQQLGFVEHEHHAHRLYTPAMLADLLQVPVSVVRRWHRRGLIRPARQVRRLPYFDFQEVATARQLAELLASGMSPQAIEKKLAELSRWLPEVERPLAQLSIIVEGKNLLLRQGEGLLEPGGQFRFDFDAPDAPASLVRTPSDAVADSAAAAEPPVALPDQLRDAAAALEEDGELARAADMYRASLAAGGPQAEVCFLLAELLYRMGDLPGARERYYMAIELDEDYVEARANLGCVLAETGQLSLAVAAFEGALTYHGEYPDAHYHLARTLDEMGRTAEADQHWQAFLKLAADSPWAELARQRLAAPE